MSVPDPPREEAFDDVAAIASGLIGTSVAQVTFATDARREAQEIGGGVRETPLDAIIRLRVIDSPDVFVVPDLAEDARFAGLSTSGSAALRFYAGARIATSDGQALGAIWVADPEPRPEGLSDQHAALLQALARQVAARLELRRVSTERDQALAREQASAQRSSLLSEAIADAVWDWDIGRDTVTWNEALRELHGHAAADVAPEHGWRLERIHPDDRERVRKSIDGVLAGDQHRWTCEYRFQQADGGYAEILDRAALFRDERGRALRMAGTMLDLTERNRTSARRAAMGELAETLRDLDDADAMTSAAAEILGRTLEVDRAGYARLDPDGQTLVVTRDWLSSRGHSYPGRFRLGDYGDFVEALHRDEMVVVADVERDGRTFLHGAALAAIGVRALVNVPVTENGRLEAILYLNHHGPRPWSEGDLAFIRNVTDATRAAVARARSVAALRASEDVFRAFAQAIPNQVWAADARGTIDWVNRRVDDYVGATGRSDPARWRRHIHPDDAVAAQAAWRGAVAQGDVCEIEFRLGRHDGEYRWFLSRALPSRGERGEIVRWIGTNTDVHEQKLIAAELAQANLLLSSRVEERTRERDRLWSTTNDLMGTAGIDGRLTTVNPAWRRMLGWLEEELLGRQPLDLVDPEDRPEAARVAQRLATGEPVEGFVGRLRGKDGSTRTVMWNAVPDRGVVYFVGRDITDQRQAEEALHQAQKMEAIGQLTGGIAHDFNNLLTGIIGSLDLLQTRMRQGRTEKLDHYLQSATTSAKRAAALTHRLLAFARRQPLDPRPVDPALLIGSLEDLLQRTMGEAIGLRIETAPGLWPILCDPNQLESAILNLAINARDAMPEGGLLTISTSNTILDGIGALLYAGLEPGPFVRIDVADTGAGMHPDVVKRAFDPFFTTKPLGQGTGLGLSMVYGFARQSGGQATIASELDQGTVVTLLLPRHRGETTPMPAADTSPALPALSRGQTVLVVEDELVVRDLVVEVLAELGLRVLQAVDGPSGLKVLRSDHHIDLLVSDVGLPALNGRLMAAEGRQTRPDLPVLFITGYAENAALSGFLEPGMELITKPFSVEALVSRVRAMLDG